MKLVFKIFILLSILCILNSCLDLCDNTLDYKVLSPNKENTVFVFERNCGATTDFATHISIRKHDKLLDNDHGNLFIAGKGKAQISDKGTISTKVVWIDDNNLLIIYDKKSIVYKKVESREGIKFKYETF